MTTTTKRDALAFDCPFCKASAGEPCRTRNSGREQTCPHSRRIELTRPLDDRYQPTRLNALCCICGNHRTVSSNHYTSCKDPNSNYNEGNRAKGWKTTRTLKCDECGNGTRHAIIEDDGGVGRDRLEELQRLALGGENALGQTAGYVQELRRTYREMFPRNPHLQHRWWIADAKDAAAAGRTTVLALCGESVELSNDYTPSRTGNQSNELVAPERLADNPIELEDRETGLWWVDQSCVDCLRVANTRRLDNKRAALKLRLIEEMQKVDAFGVDRIEELMRALNGTG